MVVLVGGGGGGGGGRGDAGAGAGCSAAIVKYAFMARCRPRRYYTAAVAVLCVGASGWLVGVATENHMI